MKFALRNLVARKRPISALNACRTDFSSCDPEIVVEMLEGVLMGYELSERHLPREYIFHHAIDYLEASGQIDEMRLARIEFSLIRVLGFNNEHRAKSLYHALMSKPEIFVEILSIVFKPRHGEARTVDDSGRAAAKNAWCLLHACKRQPGTRKDGTVNSDEFAQFVCDVRNLAKEQDRLEVCDTTLGEIMAYAPEGVDKVWPFEPARDVLEQNGSAEMLNGFHIGCLNKRGVHSRGAYEGGEQERDIAAYYRRQAYELEPTHPKLSAALINLARSYERYGVREDVEAKLRQEGR
jgi:hypothetical protein